MQILSSNPHNRGTDIWRAGQIVDAMEGCSVHSIVKALRLFEQNREVGEGDPARWLLHFAGLESGSREMEGWIEILYQGKKINSTSQFRSLLKEAEA